MALVSFKRGAQAQFAATAKNADTLYFTADSGKLFLGSAALAEGEYQFDVIQSYESSITTGKFTLTCRGDTRTSLIVGVKATSGMTFYSISGTYDTTTKLTTYTATNTSRAGGVYLFAIVYLHTHKDIELL